MKKRERFAIQVIIEWDQRWTTEEAAQAYADGWVQRERERGCLSRLAHPEVHIWTTYEL